MLKLLAVGSVEYEFDTLTLAQYEVQLSERRTTHAVGDSSSSEDVDVALLITDGVDPNEQSQFVKRMRRQRICVVAMLTSAKHPNEYLDHGVDAVIPPKCPTPAICFAVHSAHKAFRETERLIERVRGEKEVRQLIAKARSIIAHRMGVTTGDAIRIIRKESRQRKRSVADLARTIVDAAQLLAPPSSRRTDRTSASHSPK